METKFIKYTLSKADKYFFFQLSSVTAKIVMGLCKKVEGKKLI